MNKFRPLKNRIIILTLVVSTVMSTIFTFITLFIEFNLGSQKLKKTINEVEYTTIGSLKSSLWNLDTSLIDLQLNDLMRIEGIKSIHFEDDGKQVLFQKTKAPDGEFSYEKYFKSNIKTYNLYFDGTNLTNTYGGKLTITYTNYTIFKEVMTKALIIFTTQASKTFFVTFILLFLYERVITRDLVKTSRALEKIDVGALAPYSLFHSKREFNDEISNLQTQVDVLFKNLVEKNQLNKELLEKANVDKKLQEAKALNATRLASLGEMAAGIAHEINNPITIIQASCKNFNRKIAENSDLLQEDSQKHSERVDNAIKRIVQIINNMKKVSRDGSEDEVKVSSLNEAVADSLNYFEQKLSTEGVKFIYDIPIGTSAFMNEVELCQVITNIVNNSADAISNLENKWIRMRVDTSSENIKLSITDSGKGISKSLQEKIFDPFFTTKDIGEGTGLGLSISKEAMVRMHGDLEYNEDSENTEFIITLRKKNRKKKAA